MTSKPPSQCCSVGVKFSGEPTGKSIKIANKWEGYLATPSPDKVHAGAGVLYLPDVIGVWQNSKLMADQFAANGYVCLVVDLFNGDPVKLNRPADFDFPGWLTKGSTGDNPHTVEAVEPIVEASIKTLKEEYGVTKLGSVGYCFGAKYTVRYLNGDDIKVGYLAHPSFVTEDELAAIKGPLSIAAAETDTIFPTEERHKSEEILKKTGQLYQINLFSGVAHGFSVRGNVDIKAEKFAKEQAFLQAVTWFDSWLL
ncbi:related to dienelactone hydrolase family protein [Cephalotrichum gorgonifer]|uniref:Related to dienelactone hydrolase family protein n=1 Tax=Cephalotrichum gorgonifer TaxID=2041049 RepID=A0AAE8SXE3_9PEZI|nr:related to dienelactone hydrolase family protein [Cephalotrichum gorgonifer]